MTHRQEDVLIDLVLQCRVVQQAWEQHETHRSHGRSAYQASERKTVAQKIDEAWQGSMNDLARLTGDACDTGLTPDFVLSVLTRHLPTAVADKISSAVPR